MPAYIIADIEITDREGYLEYTKLAPASIEQYGGTYVVRGGAHEVLEGDWTPRRLVVVRFESVEQAKQWWASEEYREAKALRQRTADSRLLVVEGIA